MSYLFTSESVSEGHPDKVADQISDAILDAFLRKDKDAKVACEVLVTTGLVSINGEVKAEAYIDLQSVARNVIKRIGYTKAEYCFDNNSCAVISTLHEQSPDINQGVIRQIPEEQGAGDQGIMFGYASNETDNYMPLTLELSHSIVQELANIRREGKQMTYLRPDAKSQVTIEYSDDHNPIKIHTILVSTQHDDFSDETAMHQQITNDVKTILLPRVKAKLPQRIQTLFTDDFILHVNPTGKFVIWWPHGDTGLTGRKIIVDTYGGRGTHGGGAFSGKDPSKVDRSAAYAARHIAKNLVAAGIADQVLVQISYAIGLAQPLSIYVNTYWTSKIKKSDGEIADLIATIFDLRPAKIIERLQLKNPIYEVTASYGHFGRESYEQNGIEYFTREKLDYVDILKEKCMIQTTAQ